MIPQKKGSSWQMGGKDRSNHVKDIQAKIHQDKISAALYEKSPARTKNQPEKNNVNIRTRSNNSIVCKSKKKKRAIS